MLIFSEQAFTLFNMKTSLISNLLMKTHLVKECFQMMCEAGMTAFGTAFASH